MVWVNIRISRGIAFPKGKKWACIYSVKKQRIKHKRRKGNFVSLDCHESWKWQMENMHADKWRKPFKFLTSYANTVEQEYDHHFPAIGINFIVSLKLNLSTIRIHSLREGKQKLMKPRWVFLDDLLCPLIWMHAMGKVQQHGRLKGISHLYISLGCKDAY